MRISPTLTFLPSSVIPSHIKAALSEVIIEPNKSTLSYVIPFSHISTRESYFISIQVKKPRVSIQ